MLEHVPGHQQSWMSKPKEQPGLHKQTPRSDGQIDAVVVSANPGRLHAGPVKTGLWIFTLIGILFGQITPSGKRYQIHDPGYKNEPEQRYNGYDQKR
jgi:hypothetical protein